MDFLEYFYGYSEEDAVAYHLNIDHGSLPRGQNTDHFRNRVSVANVPATKMQRLRCLSAHSPPAFPRTKQEEPKQLEIPLANATMRRVFAYLCQTRGIDPEVVSAFAYARLLYESADHHNAVFVGRDEQGKVRHLHARGTLTGSSFRQTLPGSEKAYSFHWPGTSGKLYAFEAPIDLLSYISLHPDGWQDHTYVALCGVSAASIHRLLKAQPQLEEVILCLDHDEAGHKAARRIAAELLREWNVTVSAAFPSQKDWNDELLATSQEESQGLTMSM